MSSYFCQLYFFLIFWLQILATGQNSLGIEFFPPELENFSWGEKIEVNARLNETFQNNQNFFIKIKSDFPSIATVTQENFTLNGNENSFNFTINSQFIGRTKLKFYVDSESGNESLIGIFDVPVLPPNSNLQPVMTGVMTTLLVINTFVMGMQLHWQIILAQIKFPVKVGIGILTQFVTMPPIALGLGYIFLADNPAMQLALFAVACSGGSGSGSTFWTYLLKGDLDLSVTIAFSSIILSIIFIPLWLYTVGNQVIARGTNITIPFVNIIGSLLLIIIPNVIGMLVKHYKPDIAAKSTRFIKYLTVFVLIVAFSVGTATAWYVYLLITWKTLACGVLLPWTGFLVGYLVSWMFCLEHGQRIAIMIETGMQSGGLAIVLMLYSLPRPEADLTIVVPVNVMMFTVWPLVAMGMPQLIANCKNWRKKRQQVKNDSQIELNLEKKVSVLNENEEKEKTNHGFQKE